MTVTIRPALDRDLPAIGDILQPAFAAGDTYAVPMDMSAEESARWWTVPGKRVFVAEEDGVILGTYYLRANAEGPGEHVCNCGYVTDEAARGRGVASAMLAHSLTAARDAGFRAMQFNAVVSTNEGAVRLWRKSGFEVIGRAPGAFRHPDKGYVDTLIMYKSLVEVADA